MISFSVSVGAIACILGALGALGGGGALPVYGTTRYGRPAWSPYRPPYYRQPYPYAQSYPDEMYYQPEPMIHYPYYPMSRAYSKSDVYPPLYPYYYNERMRPYTYYGNEETYEPIDDTQNIDTHPDASRGSARADALPVGQETWFEGEAAPRWQNDYDDVNAAFLQNLIVSQMYNDALANDDVKPTEESPDNHLDMEGFDKHRTPDYYSERDTRDFEDEDVRELKALAGKPLYHVPKTKMYSPVASANDMSYRKQPQQWYRDTTTSKPVRHEDDGDSYSDDYPNDEPWINWSSKRSDSNTKKTTAKKAIFKPSPSVGPTTAAPSTQAPIAAAAVGGQKEIVLLRPATPVRHPFPEPVLQMLAANSPQRKRAPSVYDTIKQLLTMEESLKPKPETKSRVQKRFITSEDELVGELKSLKRRGMA